MDNDGLPDTMDSCPLIPDPLNDPDLCNWELVYSAQDPTGDIHLYYVRMSPQADGEQVQITSLGGQSWGATVSADGFIYFHHLAPGSGHFTLCRIPLDPGVQVDVADCFDWGTDAMNPVVCGPWLLYDQFMGDHWHIHAVDTSDLPGAGVPVDFLEPPRPPPQAQRRSSYRFPSCAMTPQGGWELAYSVDFLDQTFHAGNLLMDWEFWAGEFVFPLVPFSAAIYSSQDSHERRSTPGNQSTWYLESEQGGRVDILAVGADAWNLTIVSDGATNLDPAFRFSAANPFGGLLAYQSDRHGSFDVFVRSIGGGVIRVTRSDGWEGSPAFVW
jgi:hypothetical protein